MLAVCFVVYELTHQPALGAIAICLKFGWEDFLTARLGMPAPGGHRFGDDLEAPRVRLSTAPLLGDTAELRAEGLDSPAPLELPQVRRALTRLTTVLGELRDGARRRESPR